MSEKQLAVENNDSYYDKRELVFHFEIQTMTMARYGGGHCFRPPPPLISRPDTGTASPAAVCLFLSRKPPTTFSHRGSLPNWQTHREGEKGQLRDDRLAASSAATAATSAAV